MILRGSEELQLEENFYLRVSTADYVYRMEKINLKRPTCMDVRGRTKKKDGRWVGKAEEVAVTNPYH
ncbi:hypothetical protein RIF29_20039 [Crotalaria pallida]|uniref:Uncharacterized protein n=1 Tax=Crotalaria pallida TaxID=3830 RepID=A0AAN9I4N4_CROPI